MISPLLLALLCSLFTATYAGQICGYCQHELDPRYCDIVTECGDHEYCSVQRYILGGTIRYDMGCKEADMCNVQASSVGRRSYTDGRFIVCEECCNNTALCSSFDGLCGSQGLDKSSGTICYQCDAMRRPADCDRITRCNVNQQCYVGQKVASLTGDVLWESGCRDESECITSGTILPPVIGRREIRAPVNGLCSVCCSNSHLCNRGCHQSPAVPVTKIQTTTTTLVPHVAPHITIFRDPSVVYVGTNVTLTCIAEGNPSPKLEWYTMNAAPNTSSNIHKSAGNRFLTIDNFRSENYGTYACQAYNNLGEHDYRYAVLTPPTTSTSTRQTTTTTLTPPTTKHVAPHITIFRSPSVVYVGTDVTLTCFAEGNPSPQLEWHIMNTAANTSTNIHKGAGNSLLMIDNFRSENYGTYACQAYNNLGEHDYRYTVLTPPTTSTSTQQITTTTTTLPTMKHVAPHITIFRGPPVVYVGTNVTLTCIAEGNPSPQLEWSTKNAANTSSNMHIEAGNSLLMIENFRSENYGSYACRAYNSLGENDHRYITLTPPTTSTMTRPTTTTTLTPITIKHISPHITFLSHLGTVHLGTNVNLTCLAAGYPVPTIQWAFFAPNGVLPPNVRQMGNNIVITNCHPENYGRYACTARNFLGEKDRREVQISPK